MSDIKTALSETRFEITDLADGLDIDFETAATTLVAAFTFFLNSMYGDAVEQAIALVSEVADQLFAAQGIGEDLVADLPQEPVGLAFLDVTPEA
jgi:hypothetical protein